MLIPRPRKDADPDERTLVTAVPPTPPPAPARVHGDTPTVPVDDEPEKTLPSEQQIPGSRDDVPLHPATPAPAPKARPAARGAHRKKPPASQDTSQPTVPARLPQPPEKKKRSAASQAYDPASDLNLVMLGAFGALVGALLLALIPTLTSNIAIMNQVSAPLTSIGLLIASGGALTALLVMFTGARGRKPAKRLLSLLFGAVLAFLVALLPLIPWGISTLANKGVMVASPNVGVAATNEAPTASVAQVPSEVQNADENPEGAATDGSPTEAPETNTPSSPSQAPTSQTSTRSQPTTTTNRSTRSSGRSTNSTGRSTSSTSRSTSTASSNQRRVSPSNTTSGRRASPPPEDELPDNLLDDTPSGGSASSSSSSSSSNLAKKPAIAAIDVMVKSNMQVKKCFFQHQKTKGSLPARVDVKFTIRPSGKAEKVGIKQAELAATDLDFCLGSAIKSISFPPSQEGTSLTFPFVF